MGHVPGKSAEDTAGTGVSARRRLLKDGVTSKTEGSMKLGASEFWLGWGLGLSCYKAGTFCLFRESM